MIRLLTRDELIKHIEKLEKIMTSREKMLSNRDKWWITEMDKIITPPPCFNEYDTPCSELDCEDFACTYMAWQIFKRGIFS